MRLSHAGGGLFDGGPHGGAPREGDLAGRERRVAQELGERGNVRSAVATRMRDLAERLIERLGGVRLPGREVRVGANRFGFETLIASLKTLTTELEKHGGKAAGKPVDVRVSTIPTGHGERVTDPGEKKVYFEVGGYGNYVFFENPR